MKMLTKFTRDSSTAEFQYRNIFFKTGHCRCAMAVYSTAMRVLYFRLFESGEKQLVTQKVVDISSSTGL